MTKEELDEIRLSIQLWPGDLDPKALLMEFPGIETLALRSLDMLKLLDYIDRLHIDRGDTMGHVKNLLEGIAK